MSEISDLLESLANVGELDSKGEFTVSLREAGRKLGLLQLPEPRAYILKLVQWAVRSHSSHIEVEVRGETIKVWHNGETPDFRQLLRADSLLSATGAMGHLGIGLNSLLTLEPRSVRLECEGAFLKLHPELEYGVMEPPLRDRGTSLVLEGVSRRFFERSRLVAETARRYWDVIPRMFSVVPDALGFIQPERALVRQRCLKANVPIYLNGRCVLCPINSKSVEGTNFVRTDSGAANQRVRFLLAEEAKPGAIPCPPAPLGIQKTDWLFVEPGGEECRTLSPRDISDWPRLNAMEFEGKAALPGYANYYKHPMGKPGTISWLMDGVIVEETPLSAPVYVVADATDLKTDLGQFALVKDEQYKARLEWLKRWIP